MIVQEAILYAWLIKDGDGCNVALASQIETCTMCCCFDSDHALEGE